MENHEHSEQGIMDASEIAELEIFVHSQGAKPKVIVAAPGDTLRNALVRSEFLKEGQDDILVFVGEGEEALAQPDEIEDGADEHAPVDVDLTLEVLEIKRHHHVHCHRCRHVAVEVNFGGKTKHRRFSPSATDGVVAQWARKKFHLDAAAAAEYVLQLCNSTEQPRSDKHLGELVEAPKCSLCFDLVKEITPQG
ncbi:MAG: hypothetical protein ABSH35_23985 [Isosphaeraceae bacterium]|jgi:hypothetical protein